MIFGGEWAKERYTKSYFRLLIGTAIVTLVDIIDHFVRYEIGPLRISTLMGLLNGVLQLQRLHINVNE